MNASSRSGRGRSLITVVELGPPGEGDRPPPEGLVKDRIAIEDMAGAVELEAIALRATILWRPAWARLTEESWLAVRRWLDGSAPTARARLSVEVPGAVAPIGAALVLSRPGAARLRRGAPTALARGSVELPQPWVLAAPRTLAGHLQGVNQQTSAAVRASSECDAPPGIGALLRPFVALPLRLGAGRGPARDRFARSVIEAYRDVLLAAKTWERRHAPPPGGA